MLRKVLFGVLGMICFASLAAGQEWWEMFKTTRHDFGSVARGAKAEFAFELTNNLQADDTRCRRAGQLQLHHAVDRKTRVADLRAGHDYRPSQQRQLPGPPPGHHHRHFRQAGLGRSPVGRDGLRTPGRVDGSG